MSVDIDKYIGKIFSLNTNKTRIRLLILVGCKIMTIQNAVNQENRQEAEVLIVLKVIFAAEEGESQTHPRAY